MDKTVLKNIAEVIKGKTLLLGVGNPMRADDAAGPYIAEALQGVPRFEVINCLETPEKYTKIISEMNPDAIIIIDVAEFDAAPGEVKLFESNKISQSGGFSTHTMPLTLFARFIQERCNAQIFLIGIKPQRVEFNAKMSAPVRKAVEELITFFSEQK